MSSVASAFELWLADSAVMELQRCFDTTVCERFAVAGSVRRRKKIVHDIELVVIPRIDQATKPGSLLPSDVDRLEGLMGVVARKDHPTLFKPATRGDARAAPWGARQKKLLFRHEGRFLKVDLWITTRARWGSIFAIRTGDADFSHLLVKQRCFGGAMPSNLSQSDGALQHITGRDAEGHPIWEPLYTPEESDYFRALDLPVLLPEQRTKANLAELLARPAADRGLVTEAL